MGVSEILKLPHSVEEAIAAERAGRRLRYLPFWGHQPARHGGVGAGCLSRYELVGRGSTAKFGGHPELKDFLLATHGRVLVEASPVDRIWGIGLTAEDDRAASPSTWRGLNLLGFALMTARDILRLP